MKQCYAIIKFTEFSNGFLTLRQPCNNTLNFNLHLYYFITFTIIGNNCYYNAIYAICVHFIFNGKTGRVMYTCSCKKENMWLWHMQHAISSHVEQDVCWIKIYGGIYLSSPTMWPFPFRHNANILFYINWNYRFTKMFKERVYCVQPGQIICMSMCITTMILLKNFQESRRKKHYRN